MAVIVVLLKRIAAFIIKIALALRKGGSPQSDLAS